MVRVYREPNPDLPIRSPDRYLEGHNNSEVIIYVDNINLTLPVNFS